MICDDCGMDLEPSEHGAREATIEWLTDQYGVGLSSSIRVTHRCCNYFRHPDYKKLMQKHNWFDRWLPLYQFEYHREIYDQQLWTNRAIANQLLIKILRRQNENNNA